MFAVDESGLVTVTVPVVAVRFETALGTVAGHNSANVGLALSPFALTAAIENVYDVPNVRPVTVYVVWFAAIAFVTFVVGVQFAVAHDKM